MTTLAGRADVQGTMLDALERWRQGSGSVVVVSGEAGMGKSALLDWMATVSDGRSVRVDCRPPIGSFNVATIQPLQPFGLAIEQLYLNSEDVARKRLALNVGMSLLSAIPVVGDFIYAVKAISQDVNEYKRETAALQAKKRAAVADCVDTLLRITERLPTVMLIDDAHWADAQSMDVVRQIVERIAAVPLLIVWAVTPTIARTANLQAATLLRDPAIVARTVTLQPLDRRQTNDVAVATHTSLVLTEGQLTTLYDRTAGTPGVVVEYVQYLDRSGQIAPDGTISDRALADSGVHLGDHPATDVLLHDITDDDAIVLAQAAAEGREFTALVLSALLQTDVLTTIRRLRSLQRQTGLIRSVGMRTRYGVRTTVYEFTQSVAYTYFLHWPEYEERKVIHQRIADILAGQYEATTVDEVRHQLAAYIAAHATEAEDTTAAARMFAVTAEGADAMGATDVADYIRATWIPAAPVLPPVVTSGVGGMAEVAVPEAATVPIGTTIRSIADALVSGSVDTARRQAVAILAENTSTLSTGERTTIRCLAARACIEQAAWADAQAYLDAAEREADTSPRDRCTLLNVRATLALRSGNPELAKSLLLDAARLAQTLGPTARTLTMANIVVILRTLGDTAAERYARNLRRITASRAWNGLRRDLGL